MPEKNRPAPISWTGSLPTNPQILRELNLDPDTDSVPIVGVDLTDTPGNLWLWQQAEEGHGFAHRMLVSENSEEEHPHVAIGLWVRDSAAEAPPMGDDAAPQIIIPMCVTCMKQTFHEMDYADCVLLTSDPAEKAQRFTILRFGEDEVWETMGAAVRRADASSQQ